MKGKKYKYLFISSAIIIAIASVWITNSLVNQLKEEERKKIEVWAESLALFASQPEFENLDEDVSNTFNRYKSHLLNIIQDNTTIPVIVTDEMGNEIDRKNIEVPAQSSEEYLKEKIKKFADRHKPIVIEYIEDSKLYVYYDDSTVLKSLQIFPFVQLAVVFIFIAVSFLALNSTRKAEQNRVWVGLSKETAHQLGTPISSLMAWVEYLKTKDLDSKLLIEMDKDVQRLKTIAERFSKIGSNAEPEPMDLAEAVSRAIEYMGKRISSKVNIKIQFPEGPVCVLMNESLFGWVIENLVKNAVDAMDGQGLITISAFVKGNKAILDVSDTGKGIPKSKFDTVFQPGYTTKKRGWGLGLSLVRRIIESYHKGKIFVQKSELGKGTTFRIELKTL
ncbi:two-component sensor histidine kinase [Bacteroidia bacterium]|nr:two-component sensor histidine kinase [Bacteroidia bacterium]GHU80035.1 two-component sensor histidine kinase [Bacteroidia bacterium]